MQSRTEIIALLRTQNPKLSEPTILRWANILSQLKGCHIHSTIAQADDEAGWLKARTKGIGGSEIAAIRGRSSWSSPRDVYIRKVPQFGSEPESFQSEAAHWGHLLEPVVFNEWCTRTGRRGIQIPVSLQSDDNPILIANVDGFELDEDDNVLGLIEIKTTSLHNLGHWSEGEVPEYYVEQIQWYMGITGLTTTAIACCVGGQKLFYYDLPFVAPVFKAQTEEATAFWNDYVIPQIAPPATDIDAERIAKLRGEEEVTQPVVTDDEETINLLEEYVDIRQQISILEKQKKTLYAQALEKLGSASEMLAGDRLMKTSTTYRRVCDYDTLQNKYPSVYDEVISKSPSVRLYIK